MTTKAVSIHPQDWDWYIALVPRGGRPVRYWRVTGKAPSSADMVSRIRKHFHKSPEALKCVGPQQPTTEKPSSFPIVLGKGEFRLYMEFSQKGVLE